MPTSDYTPDVEMVARKNLSRTKDNFGNQVGTFDANTIPTDTQVSALTEDFMTELADYIGDDIPEETWDDAANVAAIGVAMQIELNYFSDQVNTGRSIYPQLKEQYEDKLKSLLAAVTRAIEGMGSVIDSGATLRAKFNFPDHGIGYKTVM